MTPGCRRAGHAVSTPSSELPHVRGCDHSIPLVPGAAPIAIRPYIFAPHLKDEIEKQVKEMLAAGLIQKSSSPFSSSVLLVKKRTIPGAFVLITCI